MQQNNLLILHSCRNFQLLFLIVYKLSCKQKSKILDSSVAKYGHVKKQTSTRYERRLFWLILQRCLMFIVALPSGVAKGGGGGGAARPGCHHFGMTPFVFLFFFSFETENPLIGRQRPFFYGSSHRLLSD